jgi:hypothetical protein
MKIELTNPKVWNKLSEKKLRMKERIKIYEKLGGAYRLGENKGEQVFNKLAELVKYKTESVGGYDHEVSMAQNSLDAIITAANRLKEKLGEAERNIPGWIQDHITNSENYITQAEQGFHELK